MKRYLNGWRRLGICISAVWIALVLASVVVQYASHAKGFFVYWSLPVGTRVGDGNATLPDGKVVAIEDTDPRTGRKLNAWEIDWDHQPNVPIVAQINWLRIISFLVIFPLFAWLLAEVISAAFRWIRAGFHPRRSPS